jgi:hypothetical protein
MAAAAVACATAIVGLSVVTAGPAAAAAGSWRAYDYYPPNGSSSEWTCGDEKYIAYQVYGQVCAIRSPSGASVQAALMVRNSGPLYSVAAAPELYDTSGTALGRWTCPSSGVSSAKTSVCFGQTLSHRGLVRAAAVANARDLGLSPIG